MSTVTTLSGNTAISHIILDPVQNWISISLDQLTRMPSSSLTRLIILTHISGIFGKSGCSIQMSRNIFMTRFRTLIPVSYMINTNQQIAVVTDLRSLLLYCLTTMNNYTIITYNSNVSIICICIMTAHFMIAAYFIFRPTSATPAITVIKNNNVHLQLCYLFMNKKNETNRCQ